MAEKKEKKVRTIRAVVVPARELARVEVIPDTVEALQKIVGGHFEMIMLDKDTALICNEEGKLNSLEANAALYDVNDMLIDVIFGDFLLCRVKGEDLAGFSETEAVQVLENMLLRPRILIVH